MFSFNFTQTINDLNEFSEPQQQKNIDLSTKAYYSPCQMKSHPDKSQINTLDCSFEANYESNHASIIWNKSIHYLHESLNGVNFDLLKGFNNQSLFKSDYNDSIVNKQKISDLIQNNKLLQKCQKQKLACWIKGQHQVSEVLKQLSNYFSVECFHELIYMTEKIMQKSTNCYQQNDEILIPHFCRFYDENDQIKDNLPQLTSYQPFLQHQNLNQVILKADKVTDQIAQQLFLDQNIKYFNLKDIRKQYKLNENASEEFKQFFRYIVRAIYLSSQGFFNQPTDQQETKQLCQAFIFPLCSISALQEFEQRWQETERNMMENNINLNENDQQFQQQLRSEPSKKRKST